MSMPFDGSEIDSGHIWDPESALGGVALYSVPWPAYYITLSVVKWELVRYESVESSDVLALTRGSPGLVLISQVETDGLFVGYLHVLHYTSGP